MRVLFEILRQNPILLLLLAGWVISWVGGILRRARAAQSRLPEAGPPDLTQTEADASGSRSAGADRPTPEQVAAEMRRILGMEEEPTAPPPRPASPPRLPRSPVGERRVGDEGTDYDQLPVGRAPVPVQVHRRPSTSPRPSAATRRTIAAPEPAPKPLQPRPLGQVPVHVAPHVGESIQQRQAPASGVVGSQPLGQLGGRAAGRRVGSRRPGAGLVDLHDLPRAIVLREIFDLPLALREPRS